MKTRYLEFAVLGVALLALEIRANCGVAFCPVMPGPGEQKPYAANLHTKFSSFDHPSGKGSYLELIPGASYTFKSFHAMVHVPLVSLFMDENTLGLGNPMLLGEYRFNWNRLSLALGSQFELPLGDHHSGLASDHFMGLPYATWRFNQGERLFYSGTFGVTSVIGGDHEHADAPVAVTPVFVNPHGDRELVYRALLGLGSRRFPGISAFEAYWQGQVVLSHDDEGAHYGQVGVRGNYPVTSVFGMNGFSEFHGTSPRRYDWRIGLGFEFHPTSKKMKMDHAGTM